MEGELLKIENLSISLGGKQVLRELNLKVEPGSIHAILGTNAAGKTSLAYTIMGLSGYAPQEGAIFFNGEEITHLPVSKRAKLGMTMAWQEPARFEGLSVSDYIMVGMKEKDPNLVSEALQLVLLEPREYLNRVVDRTLSGGERKRIELASVFAMRPKLAILDEPDSGIDVLALDHVVNLIKEMKRRGTTVLLITHREEVAEIADKASLLCQGFIVKEGNSREVGEYFRKKCLPCPVFNPEEKIEEVVKE
ncbi:MAG: ABC transporter ATP-binding protein [Caldiserica bacterium]|jgi:Fe-S cluster assembly ATP-binding protein|nr:ABC transporter ATP-binding protein [Caldisericota bacterium]MDH7561969.1 ABC transporter ATP-binding protein [Caldisericota bacterium]